MISRGLKAGGLLVGMIFGAGVFALPFAIYKSGIFWGSFHFLLALFLMLCIHFWYGELSYNTSEKKRFAGYVEMFLGKKSKIFSFLIIIFTYYGALLAYGLLGGFFLSNFIPFSPFFLSLLIFIIGGFLILFHFEKIANINLYLSIALVGLVFYLFFLAIPRINLTNFFSSGLNFFSSNWFLPYGIWIFSLTGFSVLPEVREIAKDFSLKNFKKIILISLLLCAFLFSLFVFTVIGISGKNTTSDALKGLSDVLGDKVLFVGSILGFLAIFTSFIALGADLKNIFRYDFNFRQFYSWLIVFFPPILFFIFGLTDFIKILDIIGTIGLGLMGILIILMIKKSRNYEENKKFFFTGLVSFILIIAGIITELISVIKNILK